MSFPIPLVFEPRRICTTRHDQSPNNCHHHPPAHGLPLLRNVFTGGNPSADSTVPVSTWRVVGILLIELMAPFAMGLALILGATLRNAVSDVVQIGSQEQVSRFDANRVIAVVQHMKPIWDWTSRDLP